MYAVDLVEGRFNLAEEYAANANTQAQEHMSQLESFLTSLQVPDASELGGIEFPQISSFDYSSIPSFTEALNGFPSFETNLPGELVLENTSDISMTFPSENLDFDETVCSAPSIEISNAPDNTISTQSISIPAKPNIQIPNVPNLTEIMSPAPPNISLSGFDAISPSLNTIITPAELNYTEKPYNSDIRMDLFAKILNDIRNGGTGLDVTIEQDLYNRGRERQRVENERLYQEIEDQFSATGFTLPSGAFASRVLQVSNEISRKNDQTNREITINQAELAQKNTQFTVDQARQVEGLLMEFFNQQENRSLEAATATAQNAVDIFNSIVAQQKLRLEKYQAEAAVFEQKIKAELVAAEIYKSQVENTKVRADIQESRVKIYNAQIGGLDAVVKLYATEMESAKVQAEVETSKIEIFKAQTEAYVAQISAEKTKADVFSSQVEGESYRAQIFSEKVKAYQSRVEAKRSEAEVQGMKIENTIKKNQLKIEEYRANLDGYKAELDAEVKTAQLQVEAFKTSASAYEVQTNVKGMEYQTRIQEFQVQIEKTKGQIQKQIAEIQAVQNGYIALKALQAEGTKGIMNVNAELAASAMNAVNVSASQGMSSSSTSSDGYSETHTYNHTTTK